MPEESFEERTESPTPKRRREAREKGTVAKSTEVNSVLVLLIGVLLIRMISPLMFEKIGGNVTKSFGLISNPGLDHASLIAYFRNSILMFLSLAIPIALVILAVGLFANIIQVGFIFTANPLIPKLEKINPLQGLKRLFSMRSIVEAIKSTFKMLIIAVVAYLTIRGDYSKLVTLSETSVGIIWITILQVGFKIVFRVALVLIFLAILDYAYLRYEHEKKLKMTRNEIKEERKQLEGDPLIKTRIRSLQREMSRRRMMEEVPKATVVVTNPTTLAIAIRYEQIEMEAPVVLAKGKHLIAERIKQIATEKDIPVVEDKILTRAMYDQVVVGEEIPMEFYNAVAEILAYVYKLKNKVAA